MNIQPKKTQHALHLILTIISGCLWLPVWIWRSISNRLYNSKSGFGSDYMKNQPKHTEHVLHAVLSFLSIGLWLPIWIWRSISNGKYNSRAGFSKSESTSPALINLLRIIRGICGFIFALQIIQLFPVATWLTQPQAVSGNMWALLILKLFLIFTFYGLFFGLYKLINYLNIRYHGIPHPVFSKTKWAL